ncbi:unnamed protein product [Caretta caretta]
MSVDQRPPKTTWCPSSSEPPPVQRAFIVRPRAMTATAFTSSVVQNINPC